MMEPAKRCERIGLMTAVFICLSAAAAVADMRMNPESGGFAAERPLASVPLAGAVTLIPAELTRPYRTDIAAARAIDRQLAPRRGTLLPSLYISLAGLNAFDAYTTTAGLSRGATEANPLVRPFAGNGAAMWAVKGGATAVSIYVAERLWRKQRRIEAISVMAITNGMMAVVAARNAAVLRGAR